MDADQLTFQEPTYLDPLFSNYGYNRVLQNKGKVICDFKGKKICRKIV